jgi:hypothetical protein
VPLHETAASALARYLDLRRRRSTMTDHVFVSPKGDRPPLATVHKGFLRLTRERSLRSGPGIPGTRLHDLRHRNLADTCWYLHATPDLLRGRRRCLRAVPRRGCAMTPIAPLPLYLVPQSCREYIDLVCSGPLSPANAVRLLINRRSEDRRLACACRLEAGRLGRVMALPRVTFSQGLSS